MSGSTFAIPASQIVSVVPSVLSAGGAGLDLVGVALTTSNRLPLGQVQPFPDRTSVANLFGATSPEAAFAATYFNGYDGAFMRPGSLWMAQYPLAAVFAWTRGAPLTGMTLAQLTAIPTGNLSVTIDGVAKTAAAVNLSTATSFSNAAQIMETALAISGPQTASFTGVITAAGVLTVTAMVAGGAIAVGNEVKGALVLTPTMITQQLTGTPGGNGTYQVDKLTAVASGALTSNEPGVAFASQTNAFRINSGSKGATSTITFPTGTIATALSMTQVQGGVISQGAAPTTPTAFMNSLIAITQNWASFTTLFDPDAGAGNALKLEFAQWTNNSDTNFVYVAWDTDVTPTLSAQASNSLGALLAASDYSGTVAFWSPADGPAKAAFVMGAIASIDYSQTNGRTTLKFRSQSGLVPDVVTGIVATNLEANNYNYYGTWSTAASNFTFMSDGSLSGPFSWIDSYINSIWLANRFQVALMTLLTNMGAVPYNPAGYGLIMAACQDPINIAANFGIFYTGVVLSAAQAAEVNSLAGVRIDLILNTQGYYLSIRDPGPEVRAVRGSPVCNFFFCDGGSVQRINLSSMLIQ
jgi:hypothetical protein